MDKTTEEKTGGFTKNGQIKVAQNPDQGFKKLGEDDKEYGVDDLVKDSEEEGEEDGD